jgi:outer membrane protein
VPRRRPVIMESINHTNHGSRQTLGRGALHLAARPALLGSVLVAILAFCDCATASLADATAPGAATSSATASLSNASTSSGDSALAPSSDDLGAVATAPAITMTLDQVVQQALATNSSVALARERLRTAAELLPQATAEALPQVTASLSDTYSSQPTVAAQGGATGAASTIPGGGTIPIITDAGGGTTGVAVSGSGQPPATSTSTPTSAPPATTAPTTPTGSQGAMIAPAQTPDVLRAYAEREQPATRSIPHQTTTTGGSGSSYNYSSFVEGSDNNYSGRVSVTQGIDIFGVVPATEDVLKRTRDFYAVDLTRVSNELALSVKTQFYNVLRDQSSVTVQDEQVKSATENLRIVQDQFNQGTAAEYDVLTAQTTLANDNQALIAAQNQLSLDQANLNTTVGIDLDQPVNLVEPPLPPLDTPIDLAADVQLAFKQRPELIQAENNIAIARHLVKLASVGLLPSLSVSGAASYSGPAYPGIPADDYSVTANLGIPLYDGGATQSRTRSAESTLRTQIITRDQLRQNVALEVRQAYLSTMNARASVSSAGAGVSQATEAARLANVRFKVGQGTFLDVINAEAQLATAQTDLATADFNYQTSLAQLTRAEGSY